MANYTTDQYIKKLNQATKKMDLKPFYEATNEIIIMQSERIFNKGTNNQGSAIGSYSTKPPIYVSLRQSPRAFPTKGKNGKTTFKNGKMHTSGYFKGGYYQFKQTVGKAVAGKNINLWLSGRFKSGFLNSANPIKALNTGFEIVYSVKHNAANPKGKVEGIVEKYPAAFKLSVKEREYLLNKFTDIFVNSVLNL